MIRNHSHPTPALPHKEGGSLAKQRVVELPLSIYGEGVGGRGLNAYDDTFCG